MILDKNTKVLVQGLGKDGTFQAQRSIEYGTNVVACVHPNRQGVLFEDRIPYFETVKDAVDETNANVGVIYVPAPFAMDAIIEQIDANLEIVVCITEGIPIHDMVKVKNHLKDKKTTLIGPNCPGIILPRLKIKVGIIPSNICHDGNVGVVSRSGTLTYEAISQIGEAGLGQSLCVGIGGDPIHGTSFIDSLEGLDLICLDDIDLIASNKDWEVGIFNLINDCLSSNSRLIFSSSKNPSSINFELDDLRSRIKRIYLAL
mgnify:CR=1 FL=1